MVSGIDKLQHVRFQGAVRPVSETRCRSIRHYTFKEAGERDIHSLSPDERKFIATVLRTATVNNQVYRLAALARRLPACLRALQVSSLTSATTLIERHAHARTIALNTLLIGVTSFFRDEEPYGHLKSLLHHHKTERFDRILSVACSDGSELYSIGMLLADVDRLAGAKMIGIDCRPEAIERAVKGHYVDSAAIPLGSTYRSKYFSKTATGYQVLDELRAPMTWQCADAFVWAHAQPFDMIACRNFAIYLEVPAAKKLWQRLHAFLRPNGVLFVGKAERPGAGFERIAPSLFRKVPL